MKICDKADQCRAKQISLVSKAWYRIEKERPHRPEHLHVDVEDFNASYMTWHLRDTSRLREVRFLNDKGLGEFPWRAEKGASYWEWMSKLLRHLSVSAPALRRLNMVSPSEGHQEPRWMGQVLPLVGALGHLESLKLKKWKYCAEDIELLSHLTGLQSLRVRALRS